MPDSRFRCADEARSRADQLAGTAPPATRWLLIEHPGPWSTDALGGSGIDRAVQRQLLASVARAGARLLLIRRPFRRGSDVVTHRRWFVVERGAATLHHVWESDKDLLAVRDVLGDDATRRQQEPGDLPNLADRPAAPMILVCTHGVRDLCCAVRGRPVAAALAAQWPELTWECSHVGGDRFAPNVVVLPDGAYYGGLDAVSAVPVIRDHLAGSVRTAVFRGFSGFPPPAQYAMITLLDRLGLRSPAQLGSLRYLSATGSLDHGWRVDLMINDAPVVVEVSGQTEPPTQLTCGAVRPSSATRYRLESVVGLQR